MSVSTPVRPAIDRPPFPDLIDRVRALAPGFAATARESEAAKRIPASTMTALRDAELFKLVKPARFGGFEYGPAEAVQVAFELGRADGSTGWCGSLAIYFHLMLSYFPLSTQEAVYASDNEIIAVSYTPSPACKAVDGGFTISGTWPYASNCDNAGWLMVACLIAAAEAGAPPTLWWILVPASEFTIDHDSWDTAGLQGTGSKSVKIAEPVFVPAERAIRVPDVMAGTTPGTRIPDNVLASFQFPTFGPSCLVAPVIGMAQGALDAFVENAMTRMRAPKPGMLNAVSGSPQLQSRIGWASATVESAKRLLVSSLQEGEQRVRAGEAMSRSERIAVRRNQGYAATQSVAVVNDLFGHNGTAGVSLDAPLQRFWRDANAAALHVTLDWEAISAMYGQNELGLEPVGVF